MSTGLNRTTAARAAYARLHLSSSKAPPLGAGADRADRAGAIAGAPVPIASATAKADAVPGTPIAKAMAMAPRVPGFLVPFVDAFVPCNKMLQIPAEVMRFAEVKPSARRMPKPVHVEFTLPGPRTKSRETEVEYEFDVYPAKSRGDATTVEWTKTSTDVWNDPTAWKVTRAGVCQVVQETRRITKFTYKNAIVRTVAKSKGVPPAFSRVLPRFVPSTTSAPPAFAAGARPSTESMPDAWESCLSPLLPEDDDDNDQPKYTLGASLGGSGGHGGNDGRDGSGGCGGHGFGVGGSCLGALPIAH